MGSINEIVDKLKEDWSSPRVAFHAGKEIPFRLSCVFSKEGTDYEFKEGLPDKLCEFWSITRSACFFEDQVYGQWGLELFNPENAESMTQQYQEERNKDFLKGDLIVGRFIGDSDLLMVRCDHDNLDFGKIYVVLPLDPREDWDLVANDFEDFLNQYVAEQGAKYWEPQ